MVETRDIGTDFVIIGAGMPGIVAAIQAARLGLSVALINNRSYLGGNASAEIRVKMDGATSASEFNFYALEGGIYHEILLENFYYNPQGNPYIWEAVLRDLILKEKNIQLFMDTNIDEIRMKNDRVIEYVAGSQLGSETRFNFYGSYFLDDTGDGTVGYLSGVKYRVGREAKSEFNEKIAPEKTDKNVLLSTMIFHANDTGEPIKFIPPKFAIDLNKTEALKYREIPKERFNFRQWYYEIGENLDQIKKSQKIIQMHYSLVYGIWNYIKNSGKFNSINYDFSYFSGIPGKRESRRLIGDYILKESDIIEQREFVDVVGHGGRAIDLHAIGGFFSKELPNKYYMLRGIYQIPYRCGYSNKVKNLFFAGRVMSTTNVAFGSTRVIGTLCTLAQALGVACYLCLKYKVRPREIYDNYIDQLQQILLEEDQFIPGIKNNNKLITATITASSTKRCKLVNYDFEKNMDNPFAIIIPVKERVKSIKILLKNYRKTIIKYSIFVSKKEANWSPDKKIIERELTLEPSDVLRWIEVPITKEVETNKLFIELNFDQEISVAFSKEKLPGVICLEKSICKSKTIFDARTLKKKKFLWKMLINSICFKINPEQDVYRPENIKNGFRRPYKLPNLWISHSNNNEEFLEINFKKVARISKINLYFDADYNVDFTPLPMTVPGYASKAFKDENAEKELFSKPSKLDIGNYNAVPTIIKDYLILAMINNHWEKIAEKKENYQSMNKIKLSKEVETDKIKIIFKSTNGVKSFRLFEIRVS